MGGFLSHGGTPSHHPFTDRFSMINHPHWGPPFWDTFIFLGKTKAFHIDVSFAAELPGYHGDSRRIYQQQCDLIIFDKWASRKVIFGGPFLCISNLRGVTTPADFASSRIIQEALKKSKVPSSGDKIISLQCWDMLSKSSPVVLWFHCPWQWETKWFDHLKLDGEPNFCKFLDGR